MPATPFMKKKYTVPVFKWIGLSGLMVFILRQLYEINKGISLHEDLLAFSLIAITCILFSLLYTVEETK